MRPFHAAIVVIAAILLVAAGATYLLTQDDGWSITYETDGGTLPDGAPVSYHEGDSFALPVPTRGRTPSAASSARAFKRSASESLICPSYASSASIAM